MLVLDKKTFKDEVLGAEGFILVDYFGDGCVPCKALMPDVEELSQKYEGKVKFCKLNTTKARRLAISQRVLGLPAIVLYKDGEKVAEVVKEEATKENIEKMITENIG
ncbi:thioredoxin TrxA [Clostridium oceanicum]|uniref:Thioredoxin n=1 Tax=Clostridium oceanicum TaxID=1543 RepID=A0ABN1JDN4_9CLOT